MKRIAMMVFVLVAAIGLLSADGSWSLGDGSLSTDPAGQSAAMIVSLNLTNSGDNQEKESIEIGFTDAAVTADSLVGEVKSTAILTNNGKLQGTLSGNRYIYWQISSPSSMKIWLEVPAEMTGQTPTNKLDWTVTTTAESGDDNGTAITEESVAESNGYLVLNRDISGGKFKYGTIGSQKLEIVTDSYATAPIDSYSATLTLKIASV